MSSRWSSRINTTSNFCMRERNWSTNANSELCLLKSWRRCVTNMKPVVTETLNSHNHTAYLITCN